MASLYPTDLPDEQWALIDPMIPPAKPGGRPRTADATKIGTPIAASGPAAFTVT